MSGIFPDAQKEKKELPKPDGYMAKQDRVAVLKFLDTLTAKSTDSVENPDLLAMVQWDIMDAFFQVHRIVSEDLVPL